MQDKQKETVFLSFNWQKCCLFLFLRKAVNKNPAFRQKTYIL